jgi:ubiquinone biosynthesis protein COQ4
VQRNASATAAAARRVEWRRAWRALRRLVADPERTEAVFELIHALAGRSGERLYRRFLATPEGRQLLAARPSLLGALSDRAGLAALPAGSLGRAYAEFMSEERLEAGGLAAAAAAVRDPDEVLDAEQRWFFDRLRDMHDLWHVVTGYGRDVAGEAANLAFTWAQTRNRGVGAIVIAAAFVGPKAGLRWQRYLLQAWRRGRRAAALPMAPWEELLPQPLDAVRARLRIQKPTDAHPGGIIVADPSAAAAS